LEAGCDAGSSRLASLAEETEHRGAGVDCVGLKIWVTGKKLREKATVSVTKEESVSLLEEIRQIVKATAFKSSTEGQVFEPAIWTRDAVEVGLVGTEAGRGRLERSGCGVV
jgi:hypothetical protein